MENASRLNSFLANPPKALWTMALPIIAVVFGELSLISIIANVIVLPLIPLAMLLTFIAGLGGMLGPFVAGWVAWPGLG